jgi:hypothetical protein
LKPDARFFGRVILSELMRYIICVKERIPPEVNSSGWYCRNGIQNKGKGVYMSVQDAKQFLEKAAQDQKLAEEIKAEAVKTG